LDIYLIRFCLTHELYPIKLSDIYWYDVWIELLDTQKCSHWGQPMYTRCYFFILCFFVGHIEFQIWLFSTLRIYWWQKVKPYLYLLCLALVSTFVICFEFTLCIAIVLTWLNLMLHLQLDLSLFKFHNGSALLLHAGLLFHPFSCVCKIDFIYLLYLYTHKCLTLLYLNAVYST
jgi:hypothetical protein